MSAPISLLDGPVSEAADYLAKLATASREAGGFIKRAEGFMDSLGQMAGQAKDYFHGLNPAAQNALIGAGIGGVGGLGIGMMGKRKQNPLATALTGALGGAAVGGGATLAKDYMGDFGASSEEFNKGIENAQDFSVFGGLGTNAAESAIRAGKGAWNSTVGFAAPSLQMPNGSDVPTLTPAGHAGALGSTALGTAMGVGTSVAMSGAGGRFNPLHAANAGQNLREYVNANSGAAGDGASGQETIRKYLFPGTKAPAGPAANAPASLKAFHNATTGADPIGAKVDHVYNNFDRKFFRDSRLGRAALGATQDPVVRSQLQEPRVEHAARRYGRYGRHAAAGLAGGLASDWVWRQINPFGIQVPGAN